MMMMMMMMMMLMMMMMMMMMMMAFVSKADYICIDQETQQHIDGKPLHPTPH